MEILLLLGGAALLLFAAQKKGGIASATLEDLTKVGSEDTVGTSPKVARFKLDLEKRILSATGRAIRLESNTIEGLRTEYAMVMFNLGHPVSTVPTGQPWEKPRTRPKFALGQIVRKPTIPRLEGTVTRTRWDSTRNEWQYFLMPLQAWYQESILEAEVIADELVTRGEPTSVPFFHTGDRVTSPDGAGTIGKSNWISWNYATNEWEYYLGELRFWYRETSLTRSEASTGPKFRVGDRVIADNGRNGIISKYNWNNYTEGYWYLVENDAFTWYQESRLRAA